MVSETVYVKEVGIVCFGEATGETRKATARKLSPLLRRVLVLRRSFREWRTPGRRLPA